MSKRLDRLFIFCLVAGVIALVFVWNPPFAGVELSGHSPKIPDGWSYVAPQLSKAGVPILRKEGDRLFSEGKKAEAAGLYLHLYRTVTSTDEKSTALLSAAQAMATTQRGKEKARTLFRRYVQDYPKKAGADAALYNLGLLALEVGDLTEALHYFVGVTADFPDSPFAENATFSARYIADLLYKQRVSLRGRIVGLASSVLPGNTIALVSFLSYIFSLLIWIVLGWDRHISRLRETKDPTLWILLLLFVTLSTLNYFADRLESKNSTEAITTSRQGE